MGLARRQALLAKLATDATLRERFLADPLAVGIEFGLGPEEGARFALLPAHQVETFAGSLRDKRLGELGKRLPLSRLALTNAAFADLFRRHVPQPGAAGVKTYRDDAVAFAGLAERAVRAGEAGPAWVADVLRYEAARLIAVDPNRSWTARWLGHSVSDLVRCARSMQAGPPSTKRTLAIWFRASRKGRLRHLQLPLPFRSRERKRAVGKHPTGTAASGTDAGVSAP